MGVAELKTYVNGWYERRREETREATAHLFEAPEPEEPKPPKVHVLTPGTKPYLLYAVAKTMAQPFNMEDLAIAAWREHPKHFGMRSHFHPDTNKVVAAVVGVRGLITRGFFVKEGPKLYRVKEES